MREPMTNTVSAQNQVGPYDFYILVVSVLSIVLLGIDAALVLSPATHDVLGFVDAFLCVLFFFDFLRSFAKAPDRARYFMRAGWLDLASSVPAVDLLRLGRIARVFRVIRLARAVRAARTIGQIVSRHRAESALAAAGTVSILLTVFASIAILQFEHDPESNILTAGDALWWAFATVTTVGYGDRFPVTLEGRIVAAVLMAVGVGLFGTLSGLVASWFLHPDSEAEVDQLEVLTAEVRRLARLVEGNAGKDEAAAS
jgi:voltage-gated potassium channel